MYTPSVDFVRPVEAVVPGSQGRVLAVLAETTAELNLRTLARLSGVSPAQVSRVLPRLVDLGIVERREAPPSSLFRLVPEHVAARAVLDLAGSTDIALLELGRLARSLPTTPASVIVFGSFARREAGIASDIDVVFVRPRGINDDDERWSASVEQWRAQGRRLTGNRLEVLEMGLDEASARLASRTQLWREIRRDGHVVHGASLDELEDARLG